MGDLNTNDHPVTQPPTQIAAGLHASHQLGACPAEHAPAQLSTACMLCVLRSPSMQEYSSSSADTTRSAGQGKQKRNRAGNTVETALGWRVGMMEGQAEGEQAPYLCQGAGGVPCKRRHATFKP